MIRISAIKLPVNWNMDDLRTEAAHILHTSPEAIRELSLVRQSIDARRKSEIHYVCTIDVSAEREDLLVKKARSEKVRLYVPHRYVFPTVTRRDASKPVIVGMGPAGLFAALFLARAGIPSVVLERGRPVEARSRDVAAFWRTGELDPVSNVQFGEGGAGTFSDGKLTTGTHDPRLGAVLDTLVAHGAPEDIRWSHKPHIGTDVLRDVVRNIRLELIRLGCEVRFEHRLVGLDIRTDVLRGVTVSCPGGEYQMPCNTLILAPGHSARDTFQMLYDTGVPMEQKAFAIGVRIEHLQARIGEAQYGPLWSKLPPTDYKLACHLPSGRSVFTFCVCPGGEVVAAASEPGRLVTNGMSHRARNGKNINGGMLVGVSAADFGSRHPLAGMFFQEHWEEAAFQTGGGSFRAPAQSAGSLLKGGTPTLSGMVEPTYRPGVRAAELDRCLPGYVVESLRCALPVFGKRLRGFDEPDALLTGVETRSSSPVRLLRGKDLQSPVRGLYPCGEGGGWAGGIMSAAADGVRVAERIANPDAPEAAAE